MDRKRKEAVSAMIYPSILFVFAIGVLVFILSYIIPSFVKLFEQQNAKLPTLTKGVLAVSTFLTNNKFIIVGVILGIVILSILLYKSSKGFRKAVQTIGMKLPIIGKIIIYREVAMFTKTFASLLNHNVFITDSMNILKTVSNNEVFKEIINESLVLLSKGAKISDAFENQWAFPVVAYEMLVTGENTGKLPMMMGYVADYYENLHTNLVKRINTFIEPILIVFIAIIVGVVVISVIIPMFDFYGAVL
jgi:type IV pilus assembly protein PilC